MKKRFELVKGEAIDFWIVEVRGEDVEQRYGRIGAATESDTRYFANSARANDVAKELIAEKEAKGYREVAWVKEPGALDTKHPPFVVRSFEACVADFAALQKGKVRKEPKRAENVGGFDIAVALKNPTAPKFTSRTSAIAEDTLYLSRGDAKLDFICDLEGAPQLLIDEEMPAKDLEWQTSGEGSWAGQEGSWIILSGDDLRSQHDDDTDESKSLRLAAWRVEEGVALAAWKGSDMNLAAVMGLSGGHPKKGWERISIWYGDG
jgi:predicted DNA-binding WGR domain protein